MLKVSPNPPASVLSNTSHGTEQNGRLLGENRREDALVHASAILDCAAATAYENADNLTGSHRKVAMGVVHLVEMAQRLVDSLIDEQTAKATV
ncbi:hypothetical protein OH708_23320 [Pseudomonas capsici]|uniref:DUF6124 family protein n=1 Tax=Pseudomonas capsici TaxID=2810614 RepID=UPI00190FF101|nr:MULTISPECIES: hypothetical protein [Pseudomonas]MCV4290850.1 hypothetical protein [Pseudomonas capsici]GFM53541.1 hypothetical protein PSCICE_48080 [Pseudomonas cichorii]GFM63301.1 hypothetical protein PSCICG_44610 [Pseudomonas cichorii]